MLRTVTCTFRTAADLDACLRDTGIDLSRGGVRLTPRVVLADELGRTNPNATEPFGGRVVVKKQFVIDDPDVRGATLAPYLFCRKPGAKLTVRVNGHPITCRWQDPRDYWQDAWTPIRLPASYLQQGLNECVFVGEEGAGWALLVEHTRWPRRSAKSVDGGATWSYSGLGGTGAFLHGEYLVRLELQRYAPEGTITSLPVDLALLAGTQGIAARATVRCVQIVPNADVPDGAAITLQVRVGTTPWYDPATWTPWQPADAPLAALPKGARFLQWQAILTTTRARVTPVLRAVKVIAQLEVARPVRAAVVAADNPPVVRSSYPFAHQRFEEKRLPLFRQQWNLDGIVDPGADDFANLVAIRNWVRRQWEDGWNKGPAAFVPPWDGFIILELASRQLTLGMCTHYATAFVHTCVALGYTARTQIMRSHCVGEVWSDTLRKWIAFDFSGDTDDARKQTFHFEHHGTPLSALEAHRALRDGTGPELTFGPPDAAEAFKMPDRIGLYDRFCIHFRNDELSSLEPGEPEHGARAYHYDEYLWWTDGQTPPLPWFSRVSSRAGDFAWTLNHAQIHLQQAGPRALQVQLDTETPNLDTLLCRIDGGDWQPCAPAFRWPLHPGANTLEVRPRNKFGRLGSVSTVVVQR